MGKSLENKYFIIINQDKIIFECLNDKNKILFTKKYILINNTINIYKELENFLNNNLINIEKSLKNFIRKVYIILDHNGNLSVNLSAKYNFDSEIINEQKINDLLNSLKYEFSNHTIDQKIIHMVINKSLIDGKEKNLSFLNEKFKDLILEVKFECLTNQSVQIIKKIFSNYQISVERILLADHLRQIIKNQKNNIVYSANKIIDGEYNNEVLIAHKRSLKACFFERFFNLFN